MTSDSIWTREAQVTDAPHAGEIENAERLADGMDGDCRVVENLKTGQVMIDGRYDRENVSDGWVRVGVIDTEYGDDFEGGKKVAESLGDDYRVVNVYDSSTAVIEEYIDE